MPKTSKKAVTKDVVSYVAEAEDTFSSIESDLKREIIASFAAAALPALIEKLYPTQGWRAKAAQEAFEVGNAMYVEFEKQ